MSGRLIRAEAYSWSGILSGASNPCNDEGEARHILYIYIKKKTGTRTIKTWNKIKSNVFCFFIV